MVKKLLFRRRSKDTTPLPTKSETSLPAPEGTLSRKDKSRYERSLKKQQRRKIIKQLIFSNSQYNTTTASTNSNTNTSHVTSRRETEIEEEENNYESRKLLIRQMQGMIAKEVTQAGMESEYDSWSDLEENFAKVYEPIPLNICMKTWEQMSKTDILKEVKSPHVRREFEGLPRDEILSKIEKMHKSAAYLSHRFGADAQSVMIRPGQDADFSSYSREEEQRPKVRIHDSWSSRASSILKNPESIYVSREEVIKKLDNSSSGVAMPKASHGSWSSVASTLLTNLGGGREPVYMSRTELIRKLDPGHIRVDVERKNSEEEESSQTLSSLSSSETESSEISTVRSAKIAFVPVESSVKSRCCESCQTSSSQHNSEFDDYSEEEDGLASSSSSCSCSSCVSYSDCSCCLSILDQEQVIQEEEEKIPPLSLHSLHHLLHL